MSDLGTRLREHYEQISPSLDTERLMEQFIGADRYRQRRRPAVAMAAAAVLTLLVIGAVGFMVVSGDGRPDVIESPQPSAPTTVTPTPESQNPSRGVFTFAEDNLCGWVSEDEVTAFVRGAYAQAGVDWNGSVVAAVPEGSAWYLPSRDYCRWETTGGGYIIARGLNPSQFEDPIEYSAIAHEYGIGFGAVSGHPDLAEGVIAANAAFGRLGFWLQGSDEVLGLEVVLGGDGAAYDIEVGPAQSQRMLFHLANSFLREMNWVPTIPVESSPLASPDTTVLSAPESWNPILTTTHAKATPPAATCPAGTDPNIAGLIGQQRPHPGWVGNLTAAFDEHSGRIVYVDQKGETWTFDVCTNLWHQMNPTGSPADHSALFDAAGGPSGVLGPLVYDVDSDVIIALNFGYVAVYSANNNTWTRNTGDEGEEWIINGFGGAVYDPESGLILTTHMLADDPPGPAQRWGLKAYDVDTNTWSTIGTIPGDIEQLDFLGYSQAIDRFIIVGFVDLQPVTVLLDPRTGETTLIFTETPTVDLGWPSAVYGPADDTVYVSSHDGRFTLCRLNTVSLTWTCSKGPEALPSSYYTAFAAALGDPINDRLVLINGLYGSFWSSTVDDVWAIDLDTGAWIQLLESSDE
jgi:hypothetical protein